MRVSTTDPITLREVPNPATHPFVIEGAGENALKIYFENEDNKRPISISRPSIRARTSPPTSTTRCSRIQAARSSHPRARRAACKTSKA